MRSRCPLSLPTLALVAVVAALSGPAFAAPAIPWHVVEKATLYDGSARVVDATIAFAGGRTPRVALMTMPNAGPTLRVAVLEADGGWRVLPIPDGILADGLPDVTLAVPAYGARQAWDVTTLGPTGFAPPTALPLPAPGASPVLITGQQPRAIVQAPEGGYALATLVGERWRTTPIGDPNGFQPIVHAGPDGRPWIFALGTSRLRVGPAGRAATVTVADVTSFLGGLDPRGRPVVAALPSAGDRVILVDGRRRRATLRLPEDVTVDDRKCLVDAGGPCRVVSHGATLDAVLPLEDGVAAIYALMTTDAQRTCRPFTGMMHPCDPAGPVNTCPEPPEFTCEDVGAPTFEPRIAWLAGGGVRDAPLAELLGWLDGATSERDPIGDVPRRVIDARVDAGGHLHLVVVEKEERDSRVRWLRLAPGAEPEGPPLVRGVVPWDSVLDLVPHSDAQLAFAGLHRLEHVGTPHTVADGVETGGDGLGVLWGAELDGLDPTRAAVVTVDVTMTEGEPCGLPGIELFHGDRGASVYLGPTSVRLLDRYTTRSSELPARLVGRHRVALQVGATGARLFIDGALAGETELVASRGPTANEHARVGQIQRCVTAGALVTWHRIAIGAGAVQATR